MRPDPIAPPRRPRSVLLRVVAVSLVAIALVPVPSGSVARPRAIAQWVIEENARPGTKAWRIPGSTPQDIEGFADRVSAQQGDRVRLYVDTTAESFHVVAYRLGWYGGAGGRRIWASREISGLNQPAPTMDPDTRMVEAPWSRSLRVSVGTRWVQGSYLLKLVSSTGGMGYVPLVIRDDASTAAIVIQHPVATWQAYNRWGGASLYFGPSGGSSDRARMVSYDRPYEQRRGAGHLLTGQPMIALVEREGLDVTYWTDLDLHARPGLVRRHRTFVSINHDEYWSTSMRAGVTAARDAGVNLAFFGANDVYWHIRVEDSPLGRDRRIVCYKVAHEDPLLGVDDSEVTVRWRQGPIGKPETALLGAMYGCFKVKSNDMVVGDSSAWVFEGTGLEDGDVIRGVESGEVDWVWPSKPTPGNIQVLAHSPVLCLGRRLEYSDMVYHSTTSGAGVFLAGTLGWFAGLRCAPPVEGGEFCDPRVETIALNILDAFASGPAGDEHPSVPNAAEFGYDLTRPISP